MLQPTQGPATRILKSACAAVCVFVLVCAVPFSAAASTTGDPGAVSPKAAKAARSVLGLDSGGMIGAAEVSIAADAANDIGGAVPLPASPVAETLSFSADAHDVWSIELQPGERLQVTLSVPTVDPADTSALLADAYLLDPWAADIDVDRAIAGTSSDGPVETFVFDYTGSVAATHFLVVGAWRGSGAYTLQWSVYASPSEADDAPAGATAFIGPAMGGSVERYHDEMDFYSISVAAGQRLSLLLTMAGTLDADVYVYAPGASAGSIPVSGSSTPGMGVAESDLHDVFTAEGGTYYICVRAHAGSGAYTLAATVGAQPVGAWDDIGQAVAIGSSAGSLGGTLDEATDANDVWYMDLVAGERVVLELSGPADPGVADFDLYAYGPGTLSVLTGTASAWSNDTISEEAVVLDAKTSGRYFIEAQAWMGSGAYTFSWKRTVTPVFTETDQVFGSNRYGTAVQLSKTTFPAGSVDTVVLATGENFADALAASGLAGAHEGALLLTPRDAVPTVVLGELTRLGANKVVIVGGTAAVSSSVETYLRNVAGYTVQRIEGSNRYATAAAVAGEVKRLMGAEWEGTAFLVRGDEFADALAVAPFAYRKGYPVLLTASTTLSGETRSAIGQTGVTDVVIAGGTSAVSATVMSSVKALPGMLTVDRVWGTNRYATASGMARYGERHFWGSAAYVGMATGADFPDALGGGAVCGARGGVLLLTEPTRLSSAPWAFLRDFKSSVLDVEVFGGPAAVDSIVLTQIDGVL
ncbi:MAG: hypothetical protein Kow0067_08830 [Coriobacteriia bacterium]